MDRLLNILSDYEREWLDNFKESHECTVEEVCKSLIIMQVFLNHCTDNPWEV